MTAEPKPSSRMLAALRGIFLLMFLTFGTTLLHEGHQAIRNRAYTLHYTEKTSWIGPGLNGGWTSENAVEFRGRGALRFGAGFIALGIMLYAWSAGLVLGFFLRPGRSAPRPGVLAIGSLSLASLLGGSLALFPPWRLHTLPFYLVVVAFTLAVVLPIPARWRKKAFPALAILVVATGLTGFPAFPLFAGFFVFLFAGANLLVLWPGLAARIERSQRRAPRARPPRPA